MKQYITDMFSNFRNAAGDDFLPDTKILKYLNKAQDDLADILKFQIPVKRTMSTVAYQEEYTIPEIIRDIRDIRVEQRPVDPAPRGIVENLAEQERDTTGYTDNYWRDGRTFGLYYIPDDDADSTTLNTTCIFSIGTIVLDDSDCGFPDRGSALIEDEIIHWTNVTDDDDADTKTLNDVTRGAEGTVRAGHTAGVTVTLRDIEIFGYRYPSKLLDSPWKGSIAASSGGSMTAGEHQVQITFYSTSLEMESAPLRLGAVTTDGTSATISITNIPVSTDPDIDYVKIYVTKAGEEIYYYNDKVAIGTTSDTITTADSFFGAELFPRYSEAYSEIPEEYHNLLEFLALKKYFMENEEHYLAQVYATEIAAKYPFMTYDQHKRRLSGARYRRRPLPQ